MEYPPTGQPVARFTGFTPTKEVAGCPAAEDKKSRGQVEMPYSERMTEAVITQL